MYKALGKHTIQKTYKILENIRKTKRAFHLGKLVFSCRKLAYNKIVMPK